MYAPIRKNRHALVIVILCFLLSALCFTAGETSGYRLPFQLAGAAAAVIAIEIACRYLFCNYLYVLSPTDAGRNDLAIVRVQGKKRVTAANFSLNEAIGIAPSSLPEKERNEQFGKPYSSADFTVDLFASDTYDLYLYFQNQTMRVRLQCDAEFARSIGERIPV